MEKYDTPIVEYFEQAGVEPDQRLRRALEIASSQHVPLLDSHVFHALLGLSARAAWHSEIEDAIERQPSSSYRSWLWLDRKTAPPPASRRLPKSATANISLQFVLARALSLRKDPRTIGSNDFLKAIALLGEEFPEPKPANLPRPHTVDLLCELLDGERHTDFRNARRTQQVIRGLLLDEGADDFQLLLSVENDRLIIRPCTVLGDFVAEPQAGVLRPHRGILQHFKALMGAFGEDEVLKLQELLNDPRAGEADFQMFFEEHTHFFRRWDLREVHPHVVLEREEGNLIPDFLLTDREAQKAAIIELKLPTTIVRRQRNRDRFAGAVMEARTQLLRYRDWFERVENRQRLVPQLGMEIFRPRLAVVIGRSADFVDAIDRQRLAADNPDIEVVTYDDMLRYAKRRSILLEKVNQREV